MRLAVGYSITPCAAVQSVTAQLSPAAVENPHAAAREVGRLAEAVLDPDLINDTIENVGDANEAFGALVHAGAGMALSMDQHYAIVTDAAVAGDALALGNALVSGDRFAMTLAGVNIGVDMGVDVVSHALSSTPLAPLGPAARFVVTIVRVAAPLVAAYERVRAQAKVPVPTLQEQVVRSYTARVTGVEGAATGLSYRSATLPPA